MVKLEYQFVQGQIMAIMDVMKILGVNGEGARVMKEHLEARRKELGAHSGFHALPSRMQDGVDDVYENLIESLTRLPASRGR